MLREARIAECAGRVVAVAGGGDGDWLQERLDALAKAGASGVLSFGLCGALGPELRVGDVVVARGLVGGVACDPAWRAVLLAQQRPLRPLGAPPPLRRGEQNLSSPVYGEGGERSETEGTGPGAMVIGLDRLVRDAAAKSELYAATGAVAIDMESHIAGRVAARHGLPFACLRVVSDTAFDTLPAAFAGAMRRGGRTDVGAMLGSLVTQPAQIPAFVRASANAVRALKRLDLIGRLLGPRLGLPDLR